MNSAASGRIVYKPGQHISVGFSTEPYVEMYEFLRDYLDFQIQRMKKQTKSVALALVRRNGLDNTRLAK
jgi:hypothetical protein